MRNCLYCKIEVGGSLEKCPLCQSKLNGEPEEAYFPKLTNLQRQSFFYKLQLFIVWIMVIVLLSIDFMFHVKLEAFPGLHWSLIPAMWIIITEFGIMRQFKMAGIGSARKVTVMVSIVLIMLLITAYFFEFWRVAFDWIVPLALLVTMVVNFALAMIDKQGSAMAYLLANILVGMIPYIVLYVRNKGTPVAWIICMIVSIILFVGAVIFKGRDVASEIRRRFSV